MNADQQRRARYFNIGNLVIFLIGALVVAVSIKSSPSGTDWQSVLLNIGTDLIVVSVVFVFGKILLIDPQKDIEERLGRIESKLETGRGVFSTREQRNWRQPFDQFVGQAKDLYLGGVALRTTARGNRTIFREMLTKGAHLRFAVLDPESHDVADIADMWHVPTEHIANDIRASLADLDYLRNLAASIQCGTVEVRLLKREPVFSFALRDPDKPQGVLLGDMRVFGLDTKSRPCWQLIPADEPWYQRFVQICEALWEDSKPWP